MASTPVAAAGRRWRRTRPGRPRRSRRGRSGPTTRAAGAADGGPRSGPAAERHQGDPAVVGRRRGAADVRELHDVGARRARVAAGPDRGRISAGPRHRAAPITSTESAASCSRSAMRRLVLARMSSLTDARRPLGGEDQVDAEAAAALGDADQRVEEVGQLAASVANSSTTTTRRGSGGARRRRHGARCSARSAAPAGAERRSRRRSSASRQRRARSARRSSRSVTTPTVWGSRAQASNALPPL